MSNEMKNKRPAIALALLCLAPTTALAQSAEVHAATEFSAFILLLKTLMVLSGFLMVKTAIEKLMAQEASQREEKTKGTYIGLAALGVSMITVGAIISIGTNTIVGAEMSPEAYNFMMSRSMDPQALLEYTNSSVYFSTEDTPESQMQVRIYKVLMMFVMCGGIFAVFKAYSIAGLALQSGTEMAGNTFAHKRVAIYAHFIGGIALINLPYTLAILNNTSIAILNFISG